jgi:hypothetical protein
MSAEEEYEASSASAPALAPGAAAASGGSVDLLTFVPAFKYHSTAVAIINAVSIDSLLADADNEVVDMAKLYALRFGRILQLGRLSSSDHEIRRCCAFFGILCIRSGKLFIYQVLFPSLRMKRSGSN